MSLKAEDAKSLKTICSFPKNKLIAIGIAPTGYISIGIVPMGIISIGIVPMGVISLGMVAMGTIATGLVSMGIIAIGGETMSFVNLGKWQIGPITIEAESHRQSEPVDPHHNH